MVPSCICLAAKNLASKRQQLVLCDQECAAAADALAVKVSEAGGLEPRFDSFSCRAESSSPRVLLVK